MRAIVAGSRSIEDICLVSRAIRESGFPVKVIISGTARGVDQLGEEWAKKNNVKVERFPADWKTYGNYAGHVRNGEMARAADCLICIWDGSSKGSKNMIETAKKAGLKIFIHKIGEQMKLRDWQKENAIQIFTDGSCYPNPNGPGGFAAIVKGDGETREISRGFKSTTVNRMELMAPLIALSTLSKRSNVIVYSDSKYVVDAVAKGWLRRWEECEWRSAEGKPTKNVDLWKVMLGALSFHSVKFEWVKGHDGHPENERCDLLAGDARKNRATGNDLGYMKLMADQQVIVDRLNVLGYSMETI